MESRSLKIGNGETIIPQSDEHLTKLLQDSIKLETEKRKYNRPSWKPLYEDMHTKAMAYRVWAVCGWSLFILVAIIEIAIRIFS